MDNKIAVSFDEPATCTAKKYAADNKMALKMDWNIIQHYKANATASSQKT